MKRVPEKMMMAAIILSCGFAMNAESPHRFKPKHALAAARKLQMLREVQASARHLGSADRFAPRDDDGNW